MNLSGVSLRDFEYVLAVADLGSFGKAAERCNVAQPSLSVQISKLEKRLKTVIFERTTRRLIVTSDGQRLIAQMRKVLLEVQTLFDLSDASDAPFGGTLRLSAIATLGPYFFPRVLHDIRGNYPGLTLVLGEGRTNDLLEALLYGTLDAILVSTPIEEQTVSIAPLFTEPFVMACPVGHPALSAGEAGWVNLPVKERLLLDEGHCLRDQALAACSEGDSSSRHATSLETLKYMVAAGEGCTLLPALAVTNVRGVQYCDVGGEEFSRTIALAWRRGDPRTNEFEALSRTLKVACTLDTISR